MFSVAAIGEQNDDVIRGNGSWRRCRIEDVYHGPALALFVAEESDFQDAKRALLRIQIFFDLELSREAIRDGFIEEERSARVRVVSEELNGEEKGQG